MNPRLALSRLRRPQGDDGVAIVMAMAYIGVFAVLMLSMLAVVVGQVKPTAQARKDVGSLNAASSGLQAALTSVRSATDVNGEGDRGQLVCSSGRPATFRTGAVTADAPGASISGVASTLPGNFTYRVSIAYFTTDPTDQSPTWLRDNALTCPMAQTPTYAYLQSYGTGANIAGAGGPTGNRGNRSQTAVYQFSVPRANIAGGKMRAFGTNICLDAGNNPVAGSTLSFQTCSSLTSYAQQLFTYRQDLTIFYGGNPALNLCVQDASSATPSTTATTTATLQRCTGVGSGSTYPYATYATNTTTPTQQIQLWSFNDNGHFASASNDGNVTNRCLQPSANAVGASLTVYACTGSTNDFRAFDPDPAVGAGKAGGNITGLPGSPTNQYVNFAEFGRCLDITGQNVNADHLIAYPCKQAPDSTKLTFNQVWKWTLLDGQQLGTMSVRTGNTDYCLLAPTTGSLVTVTPCASPATPAQQWTATGNVPDSPTTSYNLVSKSLGLCMSVDRANAITSGSSNIIVETCNGSTKQRWNSPPPQPDAGLNNIKEGSTPR